MQSHDIPSLLLLLCVPVFCLHGQTDSLVLVWQRELSAGIANRSSQFSGATTDAAGNVFAVGSTETAQNESDLLIVKYSPLGEEIWETTYDGPLHQGDGAGWVFPNPDGGVTVLGTSVTRQGGWPPDILVVRLAPDGSRIWARSFPPPADTLARSILEAQVDQAQALYVLAEENDYPYSWNGRQVTQGPSDRA